MGVVNVLYGMLDLGMISLDNVFEDICWIISVIDLLFFVDVDIGWGGVFNIVCIVKEMIKVGVVGFYIED